MSGEKRRVKMSKAKSIVITTLLAIAIFVAAFFAAVSFPVNNNRGYLNSIASNIHLGADFSGYAYTTVYPEGVKTTEDYNFLTDEEKDDYVKVGGLYVEKETYPDIDELKASVAHDAKILNERFGQKAYSSYSVAVEDGISIKISVPTNFTLASYKGRDADTRSEDLSVAQLSLGTLTAYGPLMLRTTDTSIEMTDSNGNVVPPDTLDSPNTGRDEWTTVSQVSGSNTYSLAFGFEEDMSTYFKSVTSRKRGTNAIITFNFTESGREMFKEVTTRAFSTPNKTIYFFVGETAVVSFNCTSSYSDKSLSLVASDIDTAQNSAITLNSAVNGGDLSLKYDSNITIATSTAAYGENAAVLAFVACVIILVGVAVLLTVKYKKLGFVNSLIAFVFALVELYALYLLNIQVTIGVLVTCFVTLMLFLVSNVALFAEVRRLTLGGRTMQASVKEAYKKSIMTVTDLHVVLVVVAILLAAICAGEVAACGLLAVVGVVASYVLYWFTRFMWYVTSSSAKDKFKFAGFKRVVHEYE